MEFYEVLAQYYDEVFPLKEPQALFLRAFGQERQIRSLLDAGCGTGSYVLALSEGGIEATGIDLSPAMIEIARRKAATANRLVHFQVTDMLKVQQVPGSFDAISCLGNTLAHVAGVPELLAVLTGFAAKADHLLVQVVNYDWVLAQHVTELPVIKTPQLIFRRFYRHLPERYIEFRMEIELLNSAMISHAGGPKLTATNKLLALTRDKLAEALNKSGWGGAQTWWGNYSGAPWSPVAGATIVSARKGCREI